MSRSIVAIASVCCLLALPSPAPAAPPACGSPFTVHFVHKDFCHAVKGSAIRAAYAKAKAICDVPSSSCRLTSRVGDKMSCTTGIAHASCSCTVDNQFLCVSSVQPNFYASLAARVGKGALSQHVYLDYRICNAATVARTTDVGLYLDWMPKPRCVLLGDIGLVDSASVTLPAYKRGVSDGCIRGTLDTGPLPAGVYKFGLKVDRKCAVTEATETDNVATATVTVGPKKTDLYGSVTYVRLGPKQYRYTFKVCRAGWAARPSFARVFEGPKPAGFVAPKIPCGSPTSAYGTIVAQGQVEVPPGCSTLDMTYTHAKTGWRMMCLALDTGCQVSEYNESNNIGCTFPLVR